MFGARFYLSILLLPPQFKYPHLTPGTMQGPPNLFLCFCPLQDVLTTVAAWSSTNLSLISRHPRINRGLNQKKNFRDQPDFKLLIWNVTKESLGSIYRSWYYLLQERTEDTFLYWKYHCKIAHTDTKSFLCVSSLFLCVELESSEPKKQ